MSARNPPLKRKRQIPEDRFNYLKQLVNEFYVSKSQSAREQVLANLANFAYNPINYEFLRQLKVIDVFLDQLSEDNEKFVEFGIGGLCNLCLDPQNKEYILGCGAVKVIEPLLSSTNDEIVISAITTLMFLVTPKSKDEITGPSIIQKMLEISKLPDIRKSNLANLFLQDYCTPQKISAVVESSS